MTDVGTLLCGRSNSDGIAKDTLDCLSQSINSFSSKALRYLKEESADDALAFGPFCARVLLEKSCAALVGRLDTFRMLYLSEFQSQPGYEHGKRSKSAFSWCGDVIPEDRVAQMWSPDQEISKISRALFSRHLDHVYWRPAVDRMLDFISSRHDPSITELLTIDSGTYIDENKGRSQQIYSTLSKSVHWEFFTTAQMFDEPTVKSVIQDTCFLVGRLGLTSHFIPTAYASLPPEEALDIYIKFREEMA